VTSRFSFMSITMPPMIDPFTTFQTHPSLETRSQVQTHTILETTVLDNGFHLKRSYSTARARVVGAVLNPLPCHSAGSAHAGFRDRGRCGYRGRVAYPSSLWGWAMESLASLLR
ncbi:MAG: hypothetical protein ACREYE_33175, partial [Gammaproteobacteria bacterium]